MEQLYRRMVLIRIFEDAVQRLFMQNEIEGTTHLYQGQEAVAVGVCAELASGDTVAATYRGHGVCLAMGTDPTALMAELLGRETGVCGGRAGSMNVIDLEHGVLGCFGIVGGSIAAATGAALAAVEKAVAAAEALAAEGIETEVVDLRSLRPLDAQTIAGSVTRTGRLVVVEDGPSFGGYAGEVIAVAAEAGPVRVRRVAMPDVPVPTSGALDDAFITSTGAIAAAARGLVGEPARIG